MISDNTTNLNLSYHRPNPCLLLLPRSLILSPPPHPLPFPSPYPYASIYIQLPHRHRFLQILQEGLCKQESTRQFDCPKQMRTTKHVSLSKTATPDNITRQFSCPKQLRTTKHVSLSEERAKRQHTPRWRSGGGGEGGRAWGQSATDRQTDRDRDRNRERQ